MRVTIQDLDSESVIMKIEGKIAGPTVVALNQGWGDLEPLLGQKELLVDLRGVTYVDGTGRKLLAEIHGTTGAKFVADTPLTKYFAEEAQQGIRTKSED